MNAKKMMKSQKGVTLIELLVVVVILGVLAAVVIPMVISNQKDTYVNTNKQTLAVVNEALQRYAVDHGGNYPVDDDGEGNEIVDLAALVGDYLAEEPVIYNSDGEPLNLTTNPFPFENGKASLPAGAAQ